MIFKESKPYKNKLNSREVRPMAIAEINLKQIIRILVVQIWNFNFLFFGQCDILMTWEMKFLKTILDEI